jgi:intermediate peptidase
MTAIQNIFDKQSRNTAIGTTGMFGYRNIKTPNDLMAISKQSLNHAANLVDLIVGSNDSDDTVKQIDGLSDLICSLLDSAELLRNIHPDKQWVNVANDCYVELHTYLNTLNTNTAIYTVPPQI